MNTQEAIDNARRHLDDLQKQGKEAFTEAKGKVEEELDDLRQYYEDEVE